MIRLAVLMAASAALAPEAQAEGWDQLREQPITPETTLFLDVLAPETELISWRGLGEVIVTDPDGVELGVLASKETMEPTVEGTYTLQFDMIQSEFWNVTVMGAPAGMGRLSSDAWDFDTDVWDEQSAADFSFFARVESGAGAHSAVVEIDAEGLAGREWRILANGTGVEGRDAGRSVSQTRQKVAPGHRLYLQPPELADYDCAVPEAWDLRVSHDDSSCGGVAPGYAGATFRFDTSSGGTWRIVCDVDGNNEYDISSNIDVVRTGQAQPGANTVRWYGRDNTGEPMLPGTYACMLTVTAGEVHVIADDIETAFPGLRTFELMRDGGRAPRAMFWNDWAIQDAAVTMPNGILSAVSSGELGVDPGSYDEAARANDNAHAWGDYSEEGKGDFSFIDTFTWLDEVTVGPVDVTVVDVTEDDDGDGTPDACQLDYYRGGCSSVPAGPMGVLSALVTAIALLLPHRRRDRGGVPRPVR